MNLKSSPFKFIAYLLMLVSILYFPSCDIINPKEDVPAFLYIDTFHLVTDLGEGSNSHNITEAWIYVDNRLINVVELPALVPVLAEGQRELLISPGIKENGISTIRTVYPFYESYTTNFSFSAATVDTIIPSIGYRDSLKFPFLEGFESGNNFTGMETTSDPSLVFEGTRSGKIELDASKISATAISSLLNLPGASRELFLEMDYRNSLKFDVFVRSVKFNPSNITDHYLVTISPKDAWSKIYLNLTPIVSGNPADSYTILFRTEKPDSVNKASYYWDNIKIVHF